MTMPHNSLLARRSAQVCSRLHRLAWADLCRLVAWYRVQHSRWPGSYPLRIDTGANLLAAELLERTKSDDCRASDRGIPHRVRLGNRLLRLGDSGRLAGGRSCGEVLPSLIFRGRPEARI